MALSSFPDRLSEGLYPVRTRVKGLVGHQPAAVLAPLFQDNSEWFLLFTRRPVNIGSHSDQVSFPGGKVELQDSDLLSTALRETEEEIGIHQADVRCLGQLTTFPTGTGYMVTPFVGQIPWPYSLTANPLEVASVFSVPVKWLLSPDNFIRREKPPQPDLLNLPSIRYKPYRGQVIWGATAWITYELLLHIRKAIES
ncbi:MAG: CoA pyrophosphatase [Anaerolineales bacterium]|nr:CoA pyrophosphatase [Anaerolineales bacterium]